ncbi:MAG: HlyD family efflux transporter periplasmic adaptor subunit [Rhodospirillales bacterium]
MIPNPGHLEPTRRAHPSRLGQIVRICAGLALVGLALYVSLPNLIGLVGTEAVVNGRLITVYSPIEGKVTVEPPPVGREMKAGEVAVVIEDDRQNRSFLNELRTERATLSERIEALDRQDKELLATRQDLLDRSSQFRTVRQQLLDRRIEEAQATSRAAIAVADERAGNLKRRSELFDQGHLSRAALDEAAAEARSAAEHLSEARSAVKRLQTERQAAEAGVFVDNSQNDVPYSSQRIDEIALRRQDLHARRREYEIRVHEIENQMQVEEERLERQTTSSQTAPSDAVIWQRSVARGNEVVIGAELLQFLDCDDLFLEVMLDQAHFEAVRPGSPATVRLIGSDRKIPGVVRTMRGNSVSARDTHAVAHPGDKRDGQFSVTVLVDQHALRAEPGTFCGVGRSARVWFETPFERGLQRLAALVAGDR